MADIADLDHLYGEDLRVTATGDVALVVKSDRTIQRIIRRILTVPTGAAGSAYPFQPDFGVGLGAKIGADLDTRAIAASVRSQMLIEPTVRKVPAPVVNVTEFELGAVIDVQYTDLSGIPQNFSFNLVN